MTFQLPSYKSSCSSETILFSCHNTFPGYSNPWGILLQISFVKDFSCSPNAGWKFLYHIFLPFCSFATPILVVFVLFNQFSCYLAPDVLYENWRFVIDFPATQTQCRLLSELTLFHNFSCHSEPYMFKSENWKSVIVTDFPATLTQMKIWNENWSSKVG